MTLELSNCIAVSVDDISAAERFYVDDMGFQLGERSDDWVEVTSGSLRLFLCDDDEGNCFELPVEHIPSTVAYLTEHGCKTYKKHGGEVYLKDPHGLRFCVTLKM